MAAQWLYTAALKTISASRASIAATFEPVAAALFGLVLFGQKMDGFGVAGIVCEIAALVLLHLQLPLSYPPYKSETALFLPASSAVLL